MHGCLGSPHGEFDIGRMDRQFEQRLLQRKDVFIEPGPVQQDAVVKIAQTFRSGTNDIDAIDFIEMFLLDEDQISRKRRFLAAL